jgi:allantoin racemase
MSRRIVVINPNSNAAVTDAIDAALTGLRFFDGPEIVSASLADGPFGIESEADIAAVAAPLARFVAARDDADAFVVACYSDPALSLLRETTHKPVFGIQEAGVLAAMARADLFGVIALSAKSAARHRLRMRSMGVLDRLAAEIAVDITVDQGARDPATFAKLRRAGEALTAAGAGAVILGCAGLAAHRAALEAALEAPVIDPTQAAVAMALGALAD